MSRTRDGTRPNWFSYTTHSHTRYPIGKLFFYRGHTELIMFVFENACSCSIPNSGMGRSLVSIFLLNNYQAKVVEIYIVLWIIQRKLYNLIIAHSIYFTIYK
jgi:hypothetical protein